MNGCHMDSTGIIDRTIDSVRAMLSFVGYPFLTEAAMYCICIFKIFDYSEVVCVLVCV